MGIETVGARFKAGDRVIFVGLGTNHNESGEVIRVTQGFDTIYRYDVSFAGNRIVERCFGFELELQSDQPSKCA